MNIIRPNKLGWITSLNFSFTHRDVLEFNLTGVSGSDGFSNVANELRGWMESGEFGATYKKEWNCLYCTSPNTIDNTHCKKCGAPRNFILG